MTKYDLIDKRILGLFGEIGYAKGQFYNDGGNRVVEVTNDGGGVRIVLDANTPTDLLNKLNAIETYMMYLKRKDEENK